MTSEHVEEACQNVAQGVGVAAIYVRPILAVISGGVGRVH